MSKKECPPLEIKLFGRFEVIRNGTPIPEEDWGRRKTKTLLKVLLTYPGQLFTQDQLIDALFDGENVEKARENLYGRISQLRRALEPGLKRGVDSHFILRQGEGYTFKPDGRSCLDTIVFQQCLDEARLLAERKEWEPAAEHFDAAIALHRGAFLVEDLYEDWADGARRELQRLYLGALTDLAKCYEHLGRLRQSISCCQRILALEPQREDVIRLLMSYQADAGQRAQALETYQAASQRLREHLDVEPSAELQALYAELSESQSTSDASLDPRRIAVLPFASYGPRPEDEYFAEGITEELIATLSKIRDLRVVARTSVARYHGSTKPISTISRELGVGTILEGSVRLTKDKVRITAQLIDGVTEDHLWAEQYNLDVSDVLEIQAEIAQRTSAALKLQLLSNEAYALSMAKQRNAKSHMDYLRGRHDLQRYTKRALESAIGHFEAALQMDPDDARVLTGLADSWIRMEPFTSSEESYAKAKAYAERALALDDSLPEVYTSLAFIAEGLEGDLVEMEAMLRRAIQIDPSYALAHTRLAAVLKVQGRMEEAVESLRTALSLDPLSPRLIAQYAGHLFSAKRYVKAIEQARIAIEADPESDDAWWIIWFSHAALWDWKRGEAVLQGMVEKYPKNPMAHIFLSVSVQTNGRIEEGVTLIEKALSLPGALDSSWSLHQAANNFIMAQQYNRALELLDEGASRWPNHTGFRIARAFCYFLQERYSDCLEELSMAEGMMGWKAYVPRLRGRVYAALGEIKKAEAELEKLLDLGEYPNRCLCIAYLLAGLGRIEEAVDWFERSADAHESHIATIRKLPTAPQELRDHPRFQAFLGRVGLTD